MQEEDIIEGRDDAGGHYKTIIFAMWVFFCVTSYLPNISLKLDVRHLSLPVQNPEQGRAPAKKGHNGREG